MKDLVAILPAFSPAPVVLGRQAATGVSDDDTLATVGRMAQLIQMGAQHPDVQRMAHEAIAAAGDQVGRRDRAAMVHAWVRNRIQFEQDEAIVAGALLAAGLPVAADAELLIAPWQLLAMPAPMGDCDDFTMLAGAMLRVLQVPVSIVVIAANPAAPADFSHVYLYAHLEDGSLFPVDCSHGSYAGWEAPRHYRRLALPVFELPTTGLHGLPIDDQVLLGRRNARYDIVSRPLTHRPPGLGDFDWGALLKDGVDNIAAPILKAQFGQPAAGTYIQTGQGTYYRAANGAAGANLPFPPSGGSSGSTTWILVGLGAVLLVALVGRR